MSLLASTGPMQNLKPINLILVFSQVVEMSRCLCRSELLLFSSFTTKKLRQTCQLTGPITYPTGP